jgi:hypothetical protein
MVTDAGDGLLFKDLCRISEICPINLTALPIYNNNFPLSEILPELAFFNYTQIQGFVWMPSPVVSDRFVGEAHHC